MADKVKTCYPNGVCPYCGNEIFDTAVEGEECPNCGHVYWMYEADDNYDDLSDEPLDDLLDEVLDDY